MEWLSFGLLRLGSLFFRTLTGRMGNLQHMDYLPNHNSIWRYCVAVPFWWALWVLLIFFWRFCTIRDHVIRKEFGISSHCWLNKNFISNFLFGDVSSNWHGGCIRGRLCCRRVCNCVSQPERSRLGRLPSPWDQRPSSWCSWTELRWNDTSQPVLWFINTKDKACG